MDADADANAAVLGDLVARERRSDRPAVRTAPSGREQRYRDFCTTAYKAGNFLRYLGVGPGDRVAVAPDPRPEPALALFGAALLGATVRFGDPASALAAEGDGGGRATEGASEGGGEGDPDPEGASPRVRAVVARREREADVDLPPGRRLAVYGGAPASPATAHWERDVWSENPAFPPTEVAPGAPALASGGRGNGESVHSHADLLAAAEGAAAALDLAPDDAVTLRAPLTDPRAVAAGLLAPLLAGGTVVLLDGGGDAGADPDATAAVVADGVDAPEPRTLSIDDAPL